MKEFLKNLVFILWLLSIAPVIPVVVTLEIEHLKGLGNNAHF